MGTHFESPYSHQTVNISEPDRRRLKIMRFKGDDLIQLSISPKISVLFLTSETDKYEDWSLFNYGFNVVIVSLAFHPPWWLSGRAFFLDCLNRACRKMSLRGLSNLSMSRTILIYCDFFIWSFFKWKNHAIFSLGSETEDFLFNQKMKFWSL